MLDRRGCRVSGVERDPVAAEVAEKVLDEVLVGDVAELDLVGHFGKESFDVVVFGDVLEHLADPVAALRKVRPLLTGSGSIVASIPNVGHGSVRLSLLLGRFDYRPLGLLDSTHLRFFTRGSVHQLFRDAGFTPVDVRRTTAGVFDTEVSLRREDFDEGVVDAVEGDPDSTTYQFVLRAVHEGSPDATSAEAPRSGRAPAARCRVGIWARVEPDDARNALTLRVTRAELLRRIPGATVRSFSTSDDVRPSPHDGGVPVESLGPWSPERAGSLATQLDCVVIAGDLPDQGDAAVDGGRHPARYLLEGPGHDDEDACPVVWSAVRIPDGLSSPGEEVVTDQAYRAVLDVGAPDHPALAVGPDGATVAVPDPLLLVPRLLRSDALARRLEFVRIMGWFPKTGPAVVVETSGALLPHAGALALALDSVASGSGASVVFVQTEPGDAAARAAHAIAAGMATPVYRVPGDTLVDDVVAVVANADAVAVCSPTASALGLAYERPMAYLDLAGDSSLSRLAAVTGSLSAVVSRPEELAHLLGDERFRPTAGVVAKLWSKLDTHFDRIATVADAAAAARPLPPAAGATLPPPEYVAAVELAHRRMQERLDAERRAVADHLGGLRRRNESEIEALRTERDALDAGLRRALTDGAGRDEREADLRNQRDRAVAELEALKGIRVLRMLRPARAVYARLRGGRL